MLSYISLCAVCYIAGVYLLDFIPALSAGEIIAVIIIISGIALLALRKYRKYTLIAAFFLSLGVLGCAIASDLRYNDFYELENKYVTIEGYVCDLPEQNNDLYSYKVKTVRAEYMDKEYEAGQVIKVSSYVALNYGDNIRVSGFLKEFSDKKNSSDFNVKRYYQSRGIFYRMYARELGFTGLHTKDYTLSYWLNLYKSKISDSIDKVFPNDAGAILKAVALGNKRQFSPEFKQFLIQTGTMKFFYPSFLHIYFIAALVGLIFRRFKKSSRDYILIALMLLYASVNTHSPIFAKNAAMVIVSILLLKKFGFTHYADMLSITVLIICLTNPLYCFDVGFVMSVSCGLMFYYFSGILDSIFSFIPFRGLRHAINFYIITTLGLAPLAAYYFNGISVYTNLFAPIYAVVVCILIILIPIMSALVSLFGKAFIIKPIISGLLWYFTSLPSLISHLPFAHIFIKTPNIIFIITFFITLYLLYQLFLKDMKKTHNILIATVCAGLWFSIVLTGITSEGDMEITFVNVGQGDGMVIDIKGGETVLLDGGGKYEFSSYDAGENIYLPYLADNGFFNIDKAIVSHYHSDHCLGIIAAVKNLNVKELVLPDFDKKNKYRLELEALAANKNIKVTYVSKGDTLNFDSGMVLNILSPSENELQGTDENESSIVTQLEYNGFKCLFTGDISTEIEKNLINDVEDCDVVKMAHHGSANSNCAEFAEAVKAEYAIVSMGEDNIYGFPKPEAVFNYQQSGAKVARTDINGDITVKVDTHGKYKVYKNSI